MLKRLAPLVPLFLSVVLVGCAANATRDLTDADSVASRANGFFHKSTTPHAVQRGLEYEPSEQDIAELIDDQSYEMPQLADSILTLGLELVGTRYRYGGTTVKSGFDCSGFIGYLFNEELGMKLPRSTRDMIKIDAPLIARDELEPGDLLFFSTAGSGRVSHAGIYMGDDQFIHSSSSRSGGVRVDSLTDKYWNRTFIEAKRALALAPTEQEERHP